MASSSIDARPLYARLPPGAPGDYLLRLDVVHRDLDSGGIPARTATLYSPLRVMSSVRHA